MTAEFDLIARIRARAAAHASARGDVVLGIGDDAALLRVPDGHDLAVAMDTLNAGVHFPHDTAADAIGWKSLAVNLSDLAAMGARPAWCTLSLSLPDADPAWMDGFLDGFFALAALHDVALVGGDTTRGPLSVCVTAHGVGERGAALRRDGARVGDDVWVSGTLGDAMGGLAQWHASTRDTGLPIDEGLRARLDRPTPRVTLGASLRNIATACIDLSDGLLSDLAHVCRASGCAAVVDIDSLPTSVALRGAFDHEAIRNLQCGGDDYELCFTASPDARGAVERVAVANSIPVTRIGRITTGVGVVPLRADGATWSPSLAGHEHFAGS